MEALGRGKEGKGQEMSKAKDRVRELGQGQGQWQAPRPVQEVHRKGHGGSCEKQTVPFSYSR